MLDNFLNWFTIAIPFLVSVGAVVLSLKLPSERHYKKFFLGSALVGLLFSGVIWWQQLRAGRHAEKDRANAIEETSARIAKFVKDEDAATISSLTTRIDKLQSALDAQGKTVDIIRGSNFVTGRKPLRVEVTNPPPAQLPPQSLPEIQNLKIVSERAVPSPHSDALFGTEIAIQTSVPLQPVLLNIYCAEPVSYVDFSPSANFTGIISGGGGPAKENPSIAIVSMDSPAFVPQFAMVVRIYSKSKNRVIKFSYRANNN